MDQLPLNFLLCSQREYVNTFFVYIYIADYVSISL